MKSYCFARRLLTFVLAAAMLISDQTILYAAQTSDNVQDSSQQTDPGAQSSPNQEDTDSSSEKDPETSSTEQEEPVPDGVSGNVTEPEGDTSQQEPSGTDSVEEDSTQGDTTDTPGNSLPAETSTLSPGSVPEEPGEPEAEEKFTVSENWIPKYAEHVYEEEIFDFQQAWIGQEDENYVYQDSYGSQLADETARAFCQALKSSLEELLSPEKSSPKEPSDESEENPALSLGTLITPSQELEDNTTDAFRTSYEIAAQNAFDAFWLDEAEASRLDIAACTLNVTYTGTRQEDETWIWDASAVWTLQLLDEENEKSGTEDIAEDALNTDGLPADIQESTDSQDDVSLTLSALYEQTLSYKEETLSETTKAGTHYSIAYENNVCYGQAFL